MRCTSQYKSCNYKTSHFKMIAINKWPYLWLGLGLIIPTCHANLVLRVIWQCNIFVMTPDHKLSDNNLRQVVHTHLQAGCCGLAYYSSYQTFYLLQSWDWLQIQYRYSHYQIHISKYFIAIKACHNVGNKQCTILTQRITYVTTNVPGSKITDAINSQDRPKRQAISAS